MRILNNLSPERVFYYFEDLCSVPHGSGNTAAISDYCENFAKEKGLCYRRDKLGNIVIKKSATPGKEKSPSVILQGHLDMVCEKAEGIDIDMEKEGIRLKIEGDLIGAEGTTLGGDNGIAVAMVMAMLEDDTLSHPEIIAVFTVDEETGMFGAEGLDMSDIDSSLLINIDSEEEGVFTVSCAGGARAHFAFSLDRESIKAEAYKIRIDGLKGGHSGVEIDKGRQNANILLGALLKRIPNIKIASVAGGLKDNAIPAASECVAVCADPTAIVKRFCEENTIETDKGLNITVSKAEADDCFTASATETIIEFLTTVPNGIISMSEDIEGLVQTSLNLGILKTEGNKVEGSFAVRSSVLAERSELIDRLENIAKKLGADFTADSFYPAWEYKKDSLLRDTMCRVWEKEMGTAATVSAIHAGLECGLFCEKKPGLDAVSIGPDMFDVHTPRERLSVSSTERVYNFLREVLKAI
ncbi:MAG: aminoacyl-histidine dipeptidase [Clostridia bacterium]|nr:aminoacyl-histidine dipeptidase [Clostridia bacterium]